MNKKQKKHIGQIAIAIALVCCLNLYAKQRSNAKQHLQSVYAPGSEKAKIQEKIDRLETKLDKVESQKAEAIKKKISYLKQKQKGASGLAPERPRPSRPQPRS